MILQPSCLRAFVASCRIESRIDLLAERGLHAAAASICIAVLTVAALVEPEPAGTARLLGLPSCPPPVPCFTCGLTTSLAHTVHGQVLPGLAAHPFGPPMAILLLAVPASLLWHLACGSSLRPFLCRSGRPFFIAVAAALLASWMWNLGRFLVR